MKHAYKSVNFRQESLNRIQLCNEIVRDYLGQGLKLTLRQLYYQLVSKNVIANTEKSYKALGNLVSDARLAGLIDWDAIEDRNREPVIWAEYENVQELVEDLEWRYRLPRWEGQDNYVELWVEKAALAGVLRPLASKYHVTLMVNRGYSSQSAMYESAQRFLRRCTEGGHKQPILFYLGDHDPSGEDMVRDIEDRLVMFGVHGIEVRKLALTMEQVREYDPPPNPAKMTDSRAARYVEEHGADSWEVDALNPKTLASIIETAFQSVTDMDMMNAVIAKEKKERKHLKAALPRLVKDIAKAVNADDGEDSGEDEE
jgi:hypothetical protein